MRRQQLIGWSLGYADASAYREDVAERAFGFVCVTPSKRYRAHRGRQVGGETRAAFLARRALPSNSGVAKQQKQHEHEQQHAANADAATVSIARIAKATATDDQQDQDNQEN
jgi:hypothetical protein